ncbi:Hypothetical protein Tpal_1744 [Trichococcus palustris]|jgi:nucleoid-associated protein EbfC|uniref:Nucleoid-associated protein Tpal_1744 n=1 Tax=Trichococcus palustris TaxID=140314 RepID=A0A143YMW9_9LACT|nr:YbaB/EbfC family nucleoid-associated protein [Trichococcus palustris]CZQ94099.1 Hypothetical protein Tpal_1744 [Trichococcus palustris]SFL18161.1 hypothetical protein SAMN04488076_1315 [Trichococcus palustris]
MRGGMGNMQGMMKQMQKMQKELEQTQEVINATQFVGEASNGLVKITMTGNKKVVDVVIAAEAVDPDDVEMLQDLVLMATNDALAKIEVETKAKLGKFANIPGL